jgi:hypothetical protein
LWIFDTFSSRQLAMTRNDLAPSRRRPGSCHLCGGASAHER